MTLTLRLLLAVILFLFSATRPLFGFPVLRATAGVNKELQNNTNQAANNIEILLAGTYSGVNHWDGYPGHYFTSYTETQIGGNTLLSWSLPIDKTTGNSADVLPGQTAHVGFLVPGYTVTILDIFWSRNGNKIGCITQTGIDALHNKVIYANNILHCQSVSRYVGGITIEWYSHKVPLGKLNARDKRNPIRTDPIQRGVIRIRPGEKREIVIAEAPPQARYGVIIYKVSNNPRLAGRDVTTDFMEFTLERTR